MIRLLAAPIRDVAAALSRRIGTAFSTFLLAQGAPADLTHQLILSLGVLAGLAFDVSLSIYDKRSRR